jgi:hypothetical protein
MADFYERGDEPYDSTESELLDQRHFTTEFFSQRSVTESS